MSQTPQPASPGAGPRESTAVTPAQGQPAPQEPVAARPAGMRRVLLINGIGLLVLILIALGIFYVWHQSYYFYSTDDAVVTGPTASVAPPAPGTLIGVYHVLGDTVHAGTTIATLRTATGSTVRVTSPINGTIINEGATPGEVLPAGQPLAQVADLGSLSVTAYVEENHIKDVQPGQGVDVRIDALGSDTLHGTVKRILPAAASTFSIVPSQDRSTGNYTKVTQRVPVEITLSGYEGHTLYLGESAEVTIHIHS